MMTDSSVCSECYVKNRDFIIFFCTEKDMKTVQTITCYSLTELFIENMEMKGMNNGHMDRKEWTERKMKFCIGMLVCGLFLAVAGDFAEYRKNEPQKVTYREYINDLEAGLDTDSQEVPDIIDTVYYDPDADDWRYTVWTEESRKAYAEWIAEGNSSADFRFDYPDDAWRMFEMPDYTSDSLQEHIRQYDGTACREIVKKSFQPFVIMLMPVLASLGGTLLFMILLIGFYSKKMSGFGGIRKEDILVEDTGVRFSDVIGHEEVTADLQLIVKLMQAKKNSGRTASMKFNADIPRGMLFLGEAGTGKTLLAKAVAGEAGVPFLYMNASGFVEMYVGVGAKRVRELFRLARKNAPCIIFIDEIDAVGTDRSSVTTSEQKQTINALLQEMDGFDTEEGVFIIAATNNADSLDKALVRSGRFDRMVTVSPPSDNSVRVRLFEQYLKEDACSADLTAIAKQCIGFTGADVKTVCNEARLIAIASGADSITDAILEEAVDRKVFRGNRSDRYRKEDELNLSAYHEAGHALTSVLLGIPVARATIIGTTSGTGGAVFREDSRSRIVTKQDLLNQVMVCYSGRAAEEIIFGAEHISTGAVNDIQQATQILKVYISEYGFDSESFGLLNLSVLYEQKLLSERLTARAGELAGKVYQSTIQLLSDNQLLLHRLAQSLLAEETISGRKIIHLVKGNDADEYE